MVTLYVEHIRDIRNAVTFQHAVTMGGGAVNTNIITLKEQHFIDPVWRWS
jgi:hypothetical protein